MGNGVVIVVVVASHFLMRKFTEFVLRLYKTNEENRTTVLNWLAVYAERMETKGRSAAYGKGDPLFVCTLM